MKKVLTLEDNPYERRKIIKIVKKEREGRKPTKVKQARRKQIFYLN